MTITLTAADWFGLFTQFAMLSLLSVGGAITTAPEMHRYLVTEQHWLTEAQLTSSISLAQAAPGPNVLFVALMGWNVGLNAGGGLQAGWIGLAMRCLGCLSPCLASCCQARR
jgi:chromate transporter